MIRRLLLAFALLVLPTTVPAAAAPTVRATITTLSPAVATSGVPVELTLTLANPGTDAVNDLSANFFVSTNPLVGRSQIRDIVDGDLLPTYRLIEPAAASGIDLPSGASTTITLRTTTRALGLNNERPGVYTFGVIVDGVRDVRALTFLPWLPRTTSANQLGIVPVMSLTAPPTVGVDGVFVNAELPTALLPDGRLRAQLDAMSTVDGTTWLLDPALLEAVQSIADGARIRENDDIRASTDDEMSAAANWLTDLRTLAGRTQVFAMPPADLDVRGALTFGHKTLVRNALATAGSRVDAVLGTSGVGTAVQIYEGSVTDQTWALLREAGIDAAFVSSNAYRATQQRYTPSATVSVPEFGRAPVFVVDQAMAAALTSAKSEAVQRQEFAAQLVMTYLEQPNSSRAIAIAMPPVWKATASARTAEVLNARWLEPLELTEAAAFDAETRITESKQATKRQQQQERTLRAALNRQRVLQTLTTEPAFTGAVNNAVTGLMSRWLTSNRIPDAYSGATTNTLTTYVESVRVVTRGDIVFGGEAGVVPVTIANGLPVPISVVLGASGLPSVRVEPTAKTPLQINAGKRVSVELPTRVTGSGLAYLQLWLETDDEVMIGEAVILNIRSAAYARVASYLVAAAFVTLLLLIAVNTVRRIRASRQPS